MSGGKITKSAAYGRRKTIVSRYFFDGSTFVFPAELPSVTTVVAAGFPNNQSVFKNRITLGTDKRITKLSDVFDSNIINAARISEAPHTRSSCRIDAFIYKNVINN